MSSKQSCICLTQGRPEIVLRPRQASIFANNATYFSNIQDMETKKKAFSAPPEGCALGGRLVGLVERPALV